MQRGGERDVDKFETRSRYVSLLCVLLCVHRISIIYLFSPLIILLSPDAAPSMLLNDSAESTGEKCVAMCALRVGVFFSR